MQQASSTIVIHPGSSHLRIGRASDTQPIVIPHVIAWRHREPGNQIPSRMKIFRRHTVSLFYFIEFNIFACLLQHCVPELFSVFFFHLLLF